MVYTIRLSHSMFYYLLHLIPTYLDSYYFHSVNHIHYYSILLSCLLYFVLLVQTPLMFDLHNHSFHNYMHYNTSNAYLNLHHSMPLHKIFLFRYRLGLLALLLYLFQNQLLNLPVFSSPALLYTS